MRIVELEREILAAGVKYTRKWEKVDPSAADPGAEYGNVVRVDGEIIATGCMGDITAGVEQWWKAREELTQRAMGDLINIDQI